MPLQGNAVDKVEVVRPQGPRIFVERRRAETEVELHVGVGSALGAVGLGFGGRLAEELPPRAASEAVLGQFGGRLVVRCRAEDLMGDGTKAVCQTSALRRQGQEGGLTGNTSGMPPLTALEPSSTAFSLSQSFSLPAASFQLMTVAPCSRTSTDSPVGSLAETRPASLSMFTEAWASGCCGVEASADGLLGRSTMIASSLPFRSPCRVFRGRRGSSQQQLEIGRYCTRSEEGVKSYLFWLCVSVAQLDPLSLVAVLTFNSWKMSWRGNKQRPGK